MDEEKVIAKGKRAESLMSDPVLQEALKAIKEKQTEEIVSSSPDQSDKRQNAYFLLKAIEALELQLSKIKSDGAFTEHQVRNRR